MTPRLKLTLALLSATILVGSALGGHYKRVSRLEYARDEAAQRADRFESLAADFATQADATRAKLAACEKPVHSDMQRTSCKGRLIPVCVCVGRVGVERKR